MKIYRILCLCTVIALPQFALAERESSDQSIEVVHAIIDFCAQVDPANASMYQKQSRSMFHEVSASEHDVDMHGKDDKYENAYEMTRAALGKIPKQDAVVACRGFLK
jgi:hypothetical protein